MWSYRKLMPFVILFRVLAILSVALFICASLLRSIGWYSSLFQETEVVVGGDKFLHLIVVFCISFWVRLATSTYRHLPSANFCNRVFIGLFILISIDELLQLFSNYRHFSFADLTANYVGLLLGWKASCLLLKTSFKKYYHI